MTPGIETDLCDLRRVVEGAAETIVSATLRASALTDDVALQAIFAEILEACAFEDLAGQRLTRLSDALAGRALVDPLQAGPAALGHGLSQTDADGLFADDVLRAAVPNGERLQPL